MSDSVTASYMEIMQNNMHNVNTYHEMASMQRVHRMIVKHKQCRDTKRVLVFLVVFVASYIF